MSSDSSHISISAIVVTYNSSLHIKAALERLRPQLKSAAGEIIIFDNGSNDATTAAVRSLNGAIRIITLPQNIGFGAAANAAAAHARGGYLLFVNPDLYLDDGAVGVMLAGLKTLPEAGAIVPRVRFPKGEFQATCRVLPNMRNIFFSRGSFLSFLRPGTGSRYTLPDYDAPTAVPAAAATCLMMERDTFSSLGGFDARFFMFMEDTDLCLRLGQTGKKVYFHPGAGAVHYWGTGSDISTWRRNWHHHHSVWKYFLKHYPNGFSLFLLPVLLIINLLLRTMSVAGKRER